MRTAARSTSEQRRRTGLDVVDASESESGSARWCHGRMMGRAGWPDGRGPAFERLTVHPVQTIS